MASYPILVQIRLQFIQVQIQIMRTNQIKPSQNARFGGILLRQSLDTKAYQPLKELYPMFRGNFRPTFSLFSPVALTDPG